MKVMEVLDLICKLKLKYKDFLPKVNIFDFLIAMIIYKHLNNFYLNNKFLETLKKELFGLLKIRKNFKNYIEFLKFLEQNFSLIFDLVKGFED